MKTIWRIIPLTVLLISCSQEPLKIQFDGKQKSITALGQYKIASVLITEMENGKELDSLYTMIEFESPISTVYLSDSVKGKKSGMSLINILMKKQLSYKVILENENPQLTLEHRRLIFFEIDSLNKSKQIFESDY